MAWMCPECGETIGDTFDACWACGTREDGTATPGFQREAVTANSEASEAFRRFVRGGLVGGMLIAILAILQPLFMLCFLIPGEHSLASWSQTALAGATWAICAVPGGALAGGAGAARRNPWRGTMIGIAVCVILHLLFLHTASILLRLRLEGFAQTMALAAGIGALSGYAGATYGARSKSK